MSFLDLLEDKLQKLVEGDLESILDRQTTSNLLHGLSKTIKSNLQTTANGERIAPDIFVIKVSQEPYEYWTTHKTFLEEITSDIFKAGLESGYKFNLFPRLLIEFSSELKSTDINITGLVSSVDKPMLHTEIMQSPQIDTDPTQVPQNAFLVVDGKSTYPLTETIVNIGRMSTSEIRLNDLHVSRNHIQLRATDGYYLLFDLGSVGGTFVNGKNCTSTKLTPGDVIKIGSTTLIYFQDKDDKIHSTTKFEPNGKY